jgi:hypothetical protein
MRSIASESGYSQAEKIGTAILKFGMVRTAKSKINPQADEQMGPIGRNYV